MYCYIISYVYFVCLVAYILVMRGTKLMNYKYISRESCKDAPSGNRSIRQEFKALVN